MRSRAFAFIAVRARRVGHLPTDLGLRLCPTPGKAHGRKGRVRFRLDVLPGLGRQVASPTSLQSRSTRSTWSILEGVLQWVVARPSRCCSFWRSIFGSQYFRETGILGSDEGRAATIFWRSARSHLAKRDIFGREFSGIQMISENGGILPHGLMRRSQLPGSMLCLCGVEMVSIAAGETKRTHDASFLRPPTQWIWRIAIFYA